MTGFTISITKIKTIGGEVTECKVDHNELEPLSVCCGESAFRGYCAMCHDATGFVKYCPECDMEWDVETPTP